MIQSNFKNQSGGFALLITLVVVSVVLAISMSVLELSLKQLSLSVDARDAEFALQAATGGLGCGTYARNTITGVNGFISTSSATGHPSINCMGLTNRTPATKSINQSVSGGYVNRFSYNLSPVLTAGSGPVCVILDIVVINATTNNVNNYPVGGSVGNVSCARGTVCSVVVSRGFNTSCGASASGVQIMRELTAQF